MRAPKRAEAVAGAAYFVILAVYAAFLGTWTDEEYTLVTTAHGFVYAWQRAIGFELQAPLYFAVLALWRELSPSVWFARLFSIICTTGFYFALLPILRRIAPEREPLVPALLVASNPFAIYCALDIRLYASALLISALGWLAFDGAFVSGRSVPARAAFGLLAVAALYTQYFLGFALAAYAIVLIVKGRARTLVPYALVLSLVGIAALPLLGIIGSQIGGSGETTASVASLLHQTLVHPWLEFVLPYIRESDAHHLRAPYVALALGLLFLVLYARPRLRPELGAALACAAVIEALFVAVVLVFRLDLDTRHFVVLFVPALVAEYALVAALERGPHPRIGTLLGATYAALTVVVLFAVYHQFAQDGDSKRVAAYLAAHARAGAALAVFPADALPVYARQYRGAGRFVPFPVALPAKRYDIAAIDVRDEGEARAALARLRTAPQAWLVMLGACENGATDYGCNHVLAAVRDGSRVISEHRFYDARVFELRVGR